jgi:hypothetical protein
MKVGQGPNVGCSAKGGKKGEGWKVGRKKHSYKILVGKPERKRPQRRHRPTCEDNSKVDFMETSAKSRD